MIGSDSATSVKIVGALDRTKNNLVKYITYATTGLVSKSAKVRSLTNIFLCFYHLSTHSHLARSPQYVFRAVKDLQINHAAVAARLLGISTVELHQTALEGLDQSSFDIRMAQDVIWSHQALSSIVEACPGNALCGGGNVTVFVHITWVLATQNQGDRCESASCRLSNSDSLLPVSWGFTNIFNTFRKFNK